MNKIRVLLAVLLALAAPTGASAQQLAALRAAPVAVGLPAAGVLPVGVERQAAAEVELSWAAPLAPSHEYGPRLQRARQAVRAGGRRHDLGRAMFDLGRPLGASQDAGPEGSSLGTPRLGSSEPKREIAIAEKAASAAPAPRSGWKRFVTTAKLALAAVMAAVILPACGGGSSDHGSGSIIVTPTDNYPVETHPWTWTQTYSNGHPIQADWHDQSSRWEEEDLLWYINDYRYQHGLWELTESITMNSLARAHSIHMDIGDFVDTLNPEGDMPQQRASRAGISSYWYDQVLAVGTGVDSAYDAFVRMISDPTTRDKLLDPYWTHIGVGYHTRWASWEENYYSIDLAER